MTFGPCFNQRLGLSRIHGANLHVLLLSLDTHEGFIPAYTGQAISAAACSQDLLGASRGHGADTGKNNARLCRCAKRSFACAPKPLVRAQISERKR